MTAGETSPGAIAGKGSEARAARRGLYAAGPAWGVLLVACVLPPHGVGVRACPIWNAIGTPCPGCGMTRSVSCLAHGELAWSWHYHPFGALVVVTAAWLALRPLLPREWTGRVERSRALRVAGLLVLLGFMAHGAVRAMLWASGDQTILAGPGGG